MINLHNPTLTIIDGKGEISVYPEGEPNRGDFKRNVGREPTLAYNATDYGIAFEAWEKSKISYPVEEASSIDILNMSFPVLGLDKKGKIIFDITSIMDRLELVTSCNHDCPDPEYGNCDHPDSCGKFQFFRLIPRQIKSEESQDEYVNIYDNCGLIYCGNTFYKTSKEAMSVGSIKSDIKYLGTYKLTKINP